MYLLKALTLISDEWNLDDLGDLVSNNVVRIAETTKDTLLWQKGITEVCNVAGENAGKIHPLDLEYISSNFTDLRLIYECYCPLTGRISMGSLLEHSYNRFLLWTKGGLAPDALKPHSPLTWVIGSNIYINRPICLAWNTFDFYVDCKRALEEEFYGTAEILTYHPHNVALSLERFTSTLDCWIQTGIVNQVVIFNFDGSKTEITQCLQYIDNYAKHLGEDMYREDWKFRITFKSHLAHLAADEFVKDVLSRGNRW